MMEPQDKYREVESALEKFWGDEDLLVISDDGTIIRMDVGSISLLSRSTQGVRVMRLTGDAKVISIAPTDKESDADEVSTDTEES